MIYKVNYGAAEIRTPVTWPRTTGDIAQRQPGKPGFPLPSYTTTPMDSAGLSPDFQIAKKGTEQSFALRMSPSFYQIFPKNLFRTGVTWLFSQ